MNFINKVNKYLLEHYPLIWNTRLVWMTGVNVIIHMLFFIIGYFSVSGLEDLKEHYNLSDFFFNTSVLYYNFLISIFIILIWIIFYLRNNAFKNLYSIPKSYLFKQFCIVFIIFLLSITQNYSFRSGLTTKIKSLYDWESVDADIKKFNKAGIFLIHNEDEYEIDKKQYPKPFPLKMAYANSLEYMENIDTTRAYINFKDTYYQFYTINKKKQQEKERKSILNIFENNDIDFTIRDVVDITEFKEFINPSLYNYSKELFVYGQDSITKKLQLQHHQKVLDERNESILKNEINTLLSLAEKYDLDHNLDVDTLLKMVYNPPNFLLTELINPSNPGLPQYFKSFNKKYNEEILYSKTLYYDLGRIDNYFKNVYEAYFVSSAVGLLYFFIGFAFFLGVVFFIFKTTSVKSLLLSVVASIVVLIIIVWLMSSSRRLILNSDYREFAIMLFVSFIIILFAFIAYVSKWKKLIVSINWSLALLAIPIFFLFFGLTITEYLKNSHLDKFPKDYSYKSNFDIWFTNYGFWAIILVSFFSVYVYSIYIRKLKARPE
ncbi:hypothetical protein [Polaribacter porphyrae]|uniref:Uncharacterized protein n=1 Tax=Polaribacter porphyrae TaxID=1137780 RepID=A0A2S7WKW9_9FLAO|nr:hypothetical protein [Polaribacter porphyrae]PQJ78223.1 hypothetical protein BTO18_03015 [Polaribacter porphyrae]